MHLVKARVENYRSVRDTGFFEVEPGKTIMVGPNEAGKSAVLQALQQINPPEGIKRFEALRDYPRALYNEITTKKVDPTNVRVATAIFALSEDDQSHVEEEFRGKNYGFVRYIDNRWNHWLDGVNIPTFGSVRKDLARLAAHIDGRAPATPEGSTPKETAVAAIARMTIGRKDEHALLAQNTEELREWLENAIALIDEDDEKEEERLDRLRAAAAFYGRYSAALATIKKRMPVFVLFSNYFRVRPVIHLAHLAQRLASGVLDDDQYDYGNNCLLNLLGFTAQELSDLGRADEPNASNLDQLKEFRDQLDKRRYQLNGASIRLTDEIRRVWNPNPDRAEADRLRVVADGQYLKVVVEDDLGVEIELDQRSEGFQWLVSFFVVFFAEAADKHENAILLLDEPGLSLHALKQRDFRETVSRLAEGNQTIYSTHSPFLVGPDELDLVRVVEMNDRKVGTKVHTTVTSTDPAALLPLQEALGYDLAQSLFANQRNLILEGLTDFWYVEATAALLADAGVVRLNDKIALVPANTASKVIYFATILHAHGLKVAALLDSDAAGDQAAKQEVLVHTLGNKGILRTKDHLIAAVPKAEIEDLLRQTLIRVAKEDCGWDVEKEASAQPDRPLVEILDKVSGFSKYKLAKAYVRWTRDHSASDLTEDERKQWKKLIDAINSVLK
jgi:ABC-type Na+ transport system ATPase subunit NatA